MMKKIIEIIAILVALVLVTGVVGSLISDGISTTKSGGSIELPDSSFQKAIVLVNHEDGTSTVEVGNLFFSISTKDVKLLNGKRWLVNMRAGTLCQKKGGFIEILAFG